VTAPKYDPKLKACARELELVLEKYDVGAWICLTSPTHSEFVMHLPASSGISLEDGPAGSKSIRVRIRKEERAKAEFAVWLTCGIMELCELGLNQFGNVLDALRSKSIIGLPSKREPTPHSPEMDPA